MVKPFKSYLVDWKICQNNFIKIIFPN